MSKASNRSFTTGFYFGQPGPEDHVYTGEQYQRPYDFVGVVQHYDPTTEMLWVEQRNHFQVGDRLEIMQPQGDNVHLSVAAMQTEAGESIEAARHPLMTVALPCSQPLQPFSLLRRQS